MKNDKNGECTKHPRVLKEYDVNTVGKEIFRNELESRFIYALEMDIWSQGDADFAIRNRKNLAGNLFAASIKMHEAQDFMKNAY